MLDSSLEYSRVCVDIKGYYGYDRLHLSQQGLCSNEPYKDFNLIIEMVTEELHSSFIDVVERAFCAADRGLHDLTQLLLSRVLHALDDDPGLYDDRKRQSLLGIARYFQDREQGWEAERVLERVTWLQHLPASPPDDDVHHLLANSYGKRAGLASQVLRNMWQKGFGSRSVPPNCTLPSWHRAVRRGYPRIAGVISELDGMGLSQCDLLNQQALHIAASIGDINLLDSCLKAGVAVDARDAFSRTALMLAAAHGHIEICSHLRDRHANLENRDRLYRTALEIAAHGGHLILVQKFITWGLPVNPDIIKTFSPLIAAIEGHNEGRDNTQVVLYLVDAGADVHITRGADKKNAVFLAQEKGLVGVVGEMLRRYPQNPYTYQWNFGMGDNAIGGFAD